MNNHIDPIVKIHGMLRMLHQNTWYSINTTAFPVELLVEGDEQLDRPNSQTCMDVAMRMLRQKFWYSINSTARSRRR